MKNNLLMNYSQSNPGDEAGGGARSRKSLTLKLVSLSTALVILSLTSLTTETAQAEDYVNWGKEYRLVIPNDWTRIERDNVNIFLIESGQNPADVDFDAFFCPAGAIPYFSRGYIFVASQTFDNSISLVDSIMVGLKRDFANAIAALDSVGPLTKYRAREPKYDRKSQTITQVSDISIMGDLQTMTLAMKFYDRGIVTLYCYTPDSLYAQYKDDLRYISASFSGSGLEESSDKETLKVVDVSSGEIDDLQTTPTNNEEDTSSSELGAGSFALIGGVVLIVILLALKRKKKKN